MKHTTVMLLLILLIAMIVADQERRRVLDWLQEKPWWVTGLICLFFVGTIRFLFF